MLMSIGYFNRDRDRDRDQRDRNSHASKQSQPSSQQPARKPEVREIYAFLIRS